MPQSIRDLVMVQEQTLRMRAVPDPDFSRSPIGHLPVSICPHGDAHYTMRCVNLQHDISSSALCIGCVLVCLGECFGKRESSSSWEQTRLNAAEFGYGAHSSS